MLAMVDLPEFTSRLQARSQVLSGALCEAFSGFGESIVQKPDSDLLELEGEHYAHIRDGLFRFFYDGKVSRIYSPGDLIRIGCSDRLSDCKLLSPYAAKLTLYERTKVLDTLRCNPELIEMWTEYHELERRLLQIISAAQARRDADPEVSIQCYEAGAEIIAEGDLCTKIHELIDGHAIVSIQGTEVGVVNAGEIFGEMSFLTDTPCGASVTASEACTVQEVSKLDFESLIQARPHIMVTLSKLLAARVNDLNEKLMQRGA